MWNRVKRENPVFFPPWVTLLFNFFLCQWRFIWKWLKIFEIELALNNCVFSKLIKYWDTFVSKPDSLQVLKTCLKDVKFLEKSYKFISRKYCYLIFLLIIHWTFKTCEEMRKMMVPLCRSHFKSLMSWSSLQSSQ